MLTSSLVAVVVLSAVGDAVAALVVVDAVAWQLVADSSQPLDATLKAPLTLELWTRPCNTPADQYSIRYTPCNEPADQLRTPV